MNAALIFVGILFAVYDFAVILINPGTFLDNLTSFSHIWLVAGGFLIFTGVFQKKKKRSLWSFFSRAAKIAVSAFVSVCAVVCAVCLSLILTPELNADEEPCDYLILLGGGIDKNGNLPPSVLNRVQTAAAFLKKNEDTLCVVTGGTLKWLPYSEAPEIKRRLVAAGISGERILVEQNALDTIQNFRYSCEVLSGATGKTPQEILDSRIAVATSFYHLHRAEILAKRLGFTDIRGIASPCQKIMIPHSYLREICAYVKLAFRIILTGEPKRI